MITQLSDLLQYPKPEPTETYAPLAHHDAVGRISEMFLEKTNYSIKETNIHVHRNGTELWAEVIIDGMQMPVPGLCPTFIIRNSYNKMIAFSVMFGCKVLSCWNGIVAISELTTCKRKHTSMPNLEAVFDHFQENMNICYQRLSDHVSRMKSEDITDSDAAFQILQMAQTGSISNSDIMRVWKEWKTPSYPDFLNRNKWSLYNSATGIAKQFRQQKLEGCLLRLAKQFEIAV